MMTSVKRPTVDTTATQKTAAPRNQSVSAGTDLAAEIEPVTPGEVRTKLDLARQFVDMGDPESARHMLDEVLNEGDEVQQQEAQRLIASLP